jgi:serine/threonine protein kinase
VDEGRLDDFGELPPLQARRVDAACRCFEADWRAGRAPQIEQYLGGVEGLERAALLRELLALELELRRDRGERPDPSDYRRRFPDHVELVDPIFDEGAERVPTPDDPVPSTISLRPGACASSSDLTLSYVVAGFDRTLQSASPEDHEQLQTIFAPGRVLQGRYALERELGHGGMGQVYLGRDTRLDRSVAVKVILPPEWGRRGAGDGSEPRLRARFADEARLGANLTHPAIATVFDYGFHEGHPFTVFEYIPGETLRGLLKRRGRLPLEEVRIILGPLAQALDFAHTRHIVHCDLKPENIRATEQGSFKILDLGLAREFLREADWSGFAGTPAYASPEQAAGLSCDGRADQYALALIAFELLTGRRPFESDDWIKLLEMHRYDEPPSPRSIQPDLPDGVCSALLCALKKDPNRRHPSCEAFAVALGCHPHPSRGGPSTGRSIMKVLVIFSNPPGRTPPRLDEEDRVITRVCRNFEGSVVLVRQHASEVDDIYALLTTGGFDVIQFSGHGSEGGIYLDRSDLDECHGELVSAGRLLSLLELASKPPLVVVLLGCYTDSALQTLANAAPFVIMSKSEVLDAACTLFLSGFYEHLFSGCSIQGSFDRAMHLLSAKGFEPDSFRLARRSLIKRADGLFVESTPDPNRDSILVNLDAVSTRLGSFGMSTEELCHLIARKLRVHSWIFDGASNHAVLPVGRLLFGEFTWKDAKDVVYCTKLMKLRSDLPRRHWELWSRVLTSYNDLASCQYRALPRPADPSRRPVLEQGVRIFRYHVTKYLEPSVPSIEALGFPSLVPHAELAIASTEKAEDQMILERYPQVVSALEVALTNYHEVAVGLQPPEESGNHSGTRA